MKRTLSVATVAIIALVALTIYAVPPPPAPLPPLQRPTPTVVGGSTSDGATNAALLVDSDGVLQVNATSSGTGDVNIAEIGGNTVTTTIPVSGTVSATASQSTATNLKVAIYDSSGNSISASTNPCEGVIPTRVAISQTADTTVITAASSVKNYICGGLIVVDNSAGATEIVNIIEGTGSGCVTTQTAAILGSTTEANGMKITGNGFAISNIVPGSGTNVNTCLMQSGTARISGYLTFVQQ